MKKENRIKHNEEFSSILSKKKCVSSKCYTIFYAPRNKDHSRIGLSVSKKLGNSPERNKIRRQIRMMFIEHYDFENRDKDLVVIVRVGYLSHSYQDNLNDLEKLINRVYNV